MARQARGVAEPLVSHKGATKQLYRDNAGAEFNTVAMIWHSEPVKAIRAVIDTFETTGGRSFAYSRTSFLGIMIVGLVLNKNRRKAHTYVQSSPGLRKLFGFGPLPYDVKRALEEPDGTDDVPEDGFPSRQMHSVFEKWLEKHLDQHGLDLSFIEEQAYEHAPLDVLARHPDINLSRVAIDGKKILSPVRYDKSDDDPDKKRDPGARVWARGEERRDHMRQKYSAVGGDVPLVFYGAVVTPEAEATHVKESLMPVLGVRAARLRVLAEERGIVGFQGIEGALVTGDGAFSNTPVYRATYENGFAPCFRLPEAFNRRIIGRRRVERYKKVVMLDLCSDGTLYCPCDNHRPLHERTPMTQLAGEAGVTGHVKVRCDQGCLNNGLQFHIIFCGPTHDLEGNPLPVERDLDLVTPFWRADKRVHAIISKCCNAVEHYNGMLLTLFGLGTNDRTGRRRIHGNFAHQLWYTLADLCWNLIIGFNLDLMKRRGANSRHRSTGRTFGRTPSPTISAYSGAKAAT